MIVTLHILKPFILFLYVCSILIIVCQKVAGIVKRTLASLLFKFNFCTILIIFSNLLLCFNTTA